MPEYSWIASVLFDIERFCVDEKLEKIRCIICEAKEKIVDEVVPIEDNLDPETASVRSIDHYKEKG